MKVFISCNGEPAVGIRGIATSVDIGIEPNDQEDRESIRETLANAFGEIWDDKVYVRFEDECVDCGKLRMESEQCNICTPKP